MANIIPTGANLFVLLLRLEFLDISVRIMHLRVAPGKRHARRPVRTGSGSDLV